MSNTVKGERKVYMIPIFQISETGNNIGRFYNREEIRYLARSIELNGIIQPLIVRDVSPFEYELICGERRLRAAVMAGLSFVPCLIIHCSERQSAVYTLLENIQREDLTYFEQAESIKKLIEENGFSIEKASRQIGKSEASIRNKLRLLNFSQDEKKLLIDNSLSERYASAILAIRDISLRKNLICRIINENLSLYETENLIESLLDNKKQPRLILKDIRLFDNTINRAVSLMQRSGVDAVSMKLESDEYTEYRIRIRSCNNN